MEQLAKYFTPELYEIELRINKETEQVQGRVKIQGTAKSSTVKLHAKNLKMTEHASMFDVRTTTKFTRDGIFRVADSINFDYIPIFFPEATVSL